MTAPAHDASALNALLDDPVLASLAREAVRDYLTWDELTARPLPAGLSAELTWRLLTGIRRLSAFRFPIPDLDGRVYWSTITREGTLYLRMVERYCRTDSSVHRAVLHRHGRRLLVDSRVREAIAVCQLDGVAVSPETAEALLLGGRGPHNDTDRLLLNAHALLSEGDDLLDEPFSPKLLRRLYDRLVEGVDLEQLDRLPHVENIPNRVEGRVVTEETREKAIEQYCAYANGLIGDPSEPVPVKAQAMIYTTQYWGFFPDFNGIIGRCVFRLYATRQDYPVLGYLPVSSFAQAWAEGRIGPPLVRFAKLGDPRSEDERGVDYTADVLTHLQLTAAALEEILSAITRFRERDAQIRSSLEHDVELNYRQRSVIERALAHPESEFRIKEHRTRHNVVYATARDDLLDLAERGYLVRETRGKTFVFAPSPSLSSRLQTIR